MRPRLCIKLLKNFDIPCIINYMRMFYEKISCNRKRGFVLYIVVTVLLGLAILGFALNTFKRGAVSQLARNIDQNRLALLAQSANAEVLAMIRSQVNANPDSNIFKSFRAIFPDSSPDANLGEEIVLFPSFEPRHTLQIAQNAGYPLQIKSRAVLRVYRKAPYASVQAYNAYLDVFSQAQREGSVSVEAHERRDVRLVDLRHSLDKYALFVKHYSKDLNMTTRRLVVTGIDPDGNDISRVYLGTGTYPVCNDPQQNVWLDIFYEQNKMMPGFKQIFNFQGLKEPDHGFEDSTVAGTEKIPRLFSSRKVAFNSLGVSIDMFIKVPTVMALYEKFVNEAANACLKPSTMPFAVAGALKDKCQAGIDKLNNSNAYAQQICEDFFANAAGNDYSKCAEFQKILRTCEQEWQFHYGYTDAAGIWDVNKATRPNLPAPHKWVTALYYKGLVARTPPHVSSGHFFGEYMAKDAGVPFNPERIAVGKMARLYGDDNQTPVLVEGPVFLRFFKISYLADFIKEVPFLIPQTIQPEPVPVDFRRPEKTPDTFQNVELASSLAPTGYFSDRYMMSRQIDSISVNTLLGNSVSFYDGDGKGQSINPLNGPHPTFLHPARPSGSGATGMARGRLIDFQTVSRNYPSAADFLKERVIEHEGKKILSVDGVMYIENGDMDLSRINYFIGKGLIYLARGNVLIGNFERFRNPVETSDSLRICLRQGDFIIKDPSDDVIIESSLIALFFPSNKPEKIYQGSLILGGKANVTVFGNLLVDFLYLSDPGGTGLKAGGNLHVIHDPIIYNPACKIGTRELDPYHVSIGPVKTSFALNAGGKTF